MSCNLLYCRFALHLNVDLDNALQTVMLYNWECYRKIWTMELILKSRQVTRNLTWRIWSTQHVGKSKNKLNWSDLKSINIFIINIFNCSLMWKQCQCFIFSKPYTSYHSLRPSSERLFVVPSTNFKTTGETSFRVVASRMWNALTLFLHCLDLVDSLKKQLKTQVFRSAFN